MYSKTMAQAVSEEPVEFNDTLVVAVAPESDGCSLTVSGFLEDGLESLASDNKEEASLETLPDSSGTEGGVGVNDGGTDVEDFPEKMMSLEEEEGQVCRAENAASLVVPSFSIMQAQCKSEEDDGYCSRSSLDSPVQTSPSDSEANDPEVFALRETSSTTQPSPTGGPGKVQTPTEAGAKYPGRLTASVSAATTRGAMPAPPGVSSSYTSSHSAAAGPQKILIVNKTANVKYLIPTTAEVKSTKTLSIPSVSPVPPPPLASPQLPNLVNLKIVKPGVNKFGQITLLRIPEKDATGLSSASVSRPLAKQMPSARTLTQTNSFIARTGGGQLGSNSQVTGGPVEALEKEIGANPAIRQNTMFADEPFSVEPGTTTLKHGHTSTTLTADSPDDDDEYGCLGNVVECHSEATSVSNVVVGNQWSTCRLSPGGDTISTVSRKAAATPSACLQTNDALPPPLPSAQIGRNHADKSQLPLDAQAADDDDVIAAAAADYSSIMIDEMRNSHETVPCISSSSSSGGAAVGSAGLLNRNGAQRLNVACHQGRPPIEGIACHAIGKSQVVVTAAGPLSGPRVDKFKKPFPMASFPLGAVRLQDQGLAGKASAAASSSAAPAGKSSAGESDSPQRILTGCLSSTSFCEDRTGSVAKLAINGQIGVTNKGGVYQLGSRSNQDVTVILLPQTSLQSTPRKTNPANDATCKQVVLRIGPSQVFKAISVNTDGLRTTQPLKCDEKQGKGVGGEGTKKESPSESPSKLNLAINKTTNVMAVIDRTAAAAAAGSKDAATLSARHHPNPDKETLSLPKSSTSIGYFASLSLPSLQATNPGSSASTDSSQRLAGGKQSPSALSKSGTTSATTTQYKGQKTVVQTVRGRTNDVSSTGRSRISRQGLHTMRKSCPSVVGYLHPLIDHDYCEFSAFCADVQSSIISLTDSSIRPERRYVKKNRAARTKAMRVSQYVSENSSVDSRPKRKYCKRKQALEAETGKKHGGLNTRVKPGGKGVASPGKGGGSAGKDGVQSTTTSADDKDYVKIPGYYQDEYVYYATKRLPGRPRNRSDASSKASDVAVSKPPTTTPAAGISMFDWYKEMAQTDKTSRFGAAAEIPDCSSSSARGSYLEEASAGKDCTPVDESDVADLVMDMLPSGDLVRPMSDDMKFMSSSGIVDSLLSNPLDMLATSGGESSGDVGSTYLNLMAEEVRLMLSSMGEAELKLLESHLENEKITEEMHADGLDINSYLGDYASHDANMSQSSVSNLLDVDDINDGDLLSADIANMNIILNDLNATSRQQSTHDNTAVKLESGVIASIFDKGANDDFMGGIHDIGLSFTSDAQTIGNSSKSFERPDQFRALSLVPCPDITESSTTPACDTTSPPELTTINMFWNDLPGLLMNGKEFVRLVDIHKQIMPAKDTGILKKRCHMMGLHITNCTELQRDFLIRYMNAAKSKSTVIIAKDAAIMLIGFYVNPKSRSKGADDFELDLLIPPAKLSKPSPPPPPHHARHQWSVVSKLKQQQTGFPSSAGSHPSAGSLSAGSSDVGVTTTTVAAPERHICRTTIPHPARDGPSSSTGTDLASETGVDVKRSERLRHKHFSYADLIHGGIDDIDRRSGRQEGDRTLVDEDRSSNFGTRTFSSSLSDSEAVELENLIREQKRRRLTLEEKLHLKVLRNCQKKSAAVSSSSKAEVVLKGTRRRLLKRAKRTRRLLAWKRNRKPMGSAGDLHTLEHCYAASPAQLTGSTSKHQNHTDHHNHRKSSEHHVTRSSHADSFTSPVSPPPKAVASATKSATVVGVIHRDVTCRVNRRRRSQIGELVVELYTSNEAPCIRCSNCREMLGVEQFLKHMHWRRGSEKLVRVTITQKLHLQSSSRTPDNLAAWDEFQKKRGRFEGTPHTETTFVTPQRTRDTAVPKAPSASEDATHHPSTRHSSRVSKRKLLHPVEKYVFANKNSPTADTPAILSGPDAKRRRLTADVVDDHRSSAVVGQQNVTVATVAIPTVVNHSKFPKKSNIPPSASREKGRRRSVVPSDRLLRVTPRRSQDSRLTGASTSD